ncbi:MAG: hypothetical protein AB1416_04510 [Actinomycetota bacterium]
MEKCASYRAGVIGIAELHAELRELENAVADVEEKPFRDFLFNAEADLDVIRFVHDGDPMEVEELVRAIENRLEEYLGQGGQ